MIEREKEKIRDAVRAALVAIDEEALTAQSALAQTRALALDVWKTARTAALYLPLPREVGTEAILARCRQQGTRVCVPCRRPDAADGYAFGWMDDETELQRGPWGILEPRAPEWADKAAIDVVVTPGLAFDRGGGRLGHGRGFYDRLLSGENARNATRIGLAFAVQLVEKVPMGPADVRMHAVATPGETAITEGRTTCLQ